MTGTTVAVATEQVSYWIVAGTTEVKKQKTINDCDPEIGPPALSRFSCLPTCNNCLV